MFEGLTVGGDNLALRNLEDLRPRSHALGKPADFRPARGSEELLLLEFDLLSGVTISEGLAITDNLEEREVVVVDEVLEGLTPGNLLLYFEAIVNK